MASLEGESAVLKSQEIQESIIEAREALRALTGQEDVSTDDLTKQSDVIKNLEARYDAELTLESVLGEAPVVKVVQTPRTRRTEYDSDGVIVDQAQSEFRDLVQLSTLSKYLQAATDQHSVLDGREAELNQALDMPLLGQGGGPVDVPLHMLWESWDRGGFEIYADSATSLSNDPQTSFQAWLNKVFGITVAGFLGITTRAVPPGKTSYNVVTTGATTGTPAKGSDQDAGAYAVSTVDMGPQRLQSAFIINGIDRSRIPGLERAFRVEIRNAMMDAIDKLVVTKTTDGLGAKLTTSALRTTIALTSGVPTTFSTLPGAIIGQLDGRYATEPSDLAVILNPANYQALFTNSVNEQFARAAYGSVGIRMRNSDHIGGASATNDPIAFMSKRRGLENAAVLAIWQNMRLIPDYVTLASKDQFKLSAITHYNFKINRTANFHQIAAS